MILMKIYDHYKEINSEFDLIMKAEDKQNENELNKLKLELENELFNQENDNKSENKQ